MTRGVVWGAATSAYQIEGAYDEDGKGRNVWDIYTHDPGHISGGHNGDIACDHYHRFREDVSLMKEIGLNAYRFSVSWARLLPEGTGKVSEAGVQFYSGLIDALLENGITPYITLHHWDMPYALCKRGGWMNQESPEWLAALAKLAAERSITVWKGFFIPMGEQPPWMYPVKGSKSFAFTIRMLFSPTAFAAFFKSSSRQTGTRNTKWLAKLPSVTRVLNT